MSRTLQEVQKIREDRQDTYGDPEVNFREIAEYWSTRINNVHDTDINLTATDVAIMMVQLKIARTSSGVQQHDTYVDMANYSVIAGDLESAPCGRIDLTMELNKNG